MIKILIDNEEVVSNNNLQIKEEMLSTSSTILKNCYPKSWEEDKDYTSRYYFPKDYSKCKITDDIYHPEVIGTRIKASSMSINYNPSLNKNIEGYYGDTLQDGTPTPDTPVEIQSVTGLQNINVCGKNLFNSSIISNSKITISEDGTLNVSGVGGANGYCETGKTLSQLCPNLKVGETYYLYLDTDFYYSGTTTKKNLLYARGNWWGNTSKTITQDMLDGIVVVYGGYQETSHIKIMITKQLETTYEPYKGNTYEVNLGKNLLDESKGRLGTFNGLTISYSNGEILLNGTATALVDFYVATKVSSPTYNEDLINYMNTNIGTYTLSNNLGFENYFRIGSSYPQNTGTTTSTNKVDLIFVRIPAGTYNNKVLNIQLEKGYQATSYSPYFTPIELNKIGNYQDRIYKSNDKWYIEKQTNKVILNGSENWILSQTLTNTVHYVIPDITTVLLNCKIPPNDTTTGYLLSDYFEEKGNLYNIDSEGLDIHANKNLICGIDKTIASNLTTFKTWLSTHNTEIKYVLATPIVTEITNTELINQLESIELLEGLNNISITSANLPLLMQLYYNYKEAYTSEDLLFCGCVKNTGKISLNPREPHFVDLQILDFKTLLSEGETLNYVITNKTIVEAINQVVSSISDYGFVVGNINILNQEDIINAYSTLNKTAYDVFQYIADITQSKWTTRMIDENTIAIDFYDPTLMPQADPIQSTEEYYEENKIVDISFNYNTNDYRNKQIMTSDEVYANITQTETKIADGYTKTFMCDNKIGQITNIQVNGVDATFCTKSQEQLGVSADFVYQPGEMTFTSKNTLSAGSVITIIYYPIVKGREIILDYDESSRISTQIGRKGTISRYENRNDTTSSQELQKIGQSYIKYKGQAEITLKVVSEIDLFNVGQIVEYQAPLEDLSTEYLVKKKTIDWYISPNKLFYTYELSSNFNSENAINYFDNQRAKNQGNIGEGETITRNIDLENRALIIFYDVEIEEVQVENPTSLDFALDGVLI
jgi:hypothetical protein